jgi:RNA recognition motif-containing protein
MPAPVQLSWWQKLLKTIGLYKEPVRPPRPERRPDATEPKKAREPREQREPREPRRTKTRDARSDSSDSPSREEDAPRRGNRRERGGDREGGRQHRGGDPSTVENRRVYVGNLSYETTESDIEELFKGVGAVRRIEIVYNRSTHRSKGYGFVEMIDIDEAKRTVEILHDQFFMGRKLTVSGAKSQDHEEAEKDEPVNERQNQAMPPLAPVNPAKEEVLNLIADEPAAEVITEEPHAEIPTEEFHPETEVAEVTEATEEETKDQPSA